MENFKTNGFPVGKGFKNDRFSTSMSVYRRVPSSRLTQGTGVAFAPIPSWVAFAPIPRGMKWD